MKPIKPLESVTKSSWNLRQFLAACGRLARRLYPAASTPRSWRLASGRGLANILCLLLVGCLSAIRPLEAPQGQDLQSLLKPGHQSISGLHFRVYGYDRDRIDTLLKDAEQFYEQLMHDTGLYSFRPKEHYAILLFETKDEFLANTGLPSWSGGAAVGNSLYLFPHDGMEQILAHEMTHLIFYEYLGRDAYRWRWINEGLAMFQERNSLPGSQQEQLKAYWNKELRDRHMPVSQIMNFMPATEAERDVSLWYNQVESLVRFMIERGGRLGFAQFLEELKRASNLDQALSYSFGAKFQDLATFERLWQAELY